MATNKETELFEQLHGKGKKSPELPNLNCPQHPATQFNPDEYRSQNGGTINSAIALRAQETTSSLQSLDARLNQFEDRFAEAAVDRIDSVALRIEQKIAQRLQARQEARYKPQIVDVLAAFTVPDFAFPPAISPHSPLIRPSFCPRLPADVSCKSLQVVHTTPKDSKQ